ncbi:hypothetical protein NQD34_003973 [Periophthalmus magnuspinnatus]|nr:hypothetical protein NQD34_003973 [Periophthalmus magnuspinnatus]
MAHNMGSLNCPYYAIFVVFVFSVLSYPLLCACLELGGDSGTTHYTPAAHKQSSLHLRSEKGLKILHTGPDLLCFYRVSSVILQLGTTLHLRLRPSSPRPVRTPQPPTQLP